jgi:hypothetical protein
VPGKPPQAGLYEQRAVEGMSWREPRQRDARPRADAVGDLAMTTEPVAIMTTGVHGAGARQRRRPRPVPSRVWWRTDAPVGVCNLRRVPIDVPRACLVACERICLSRGVVRNWRVGGLALAGRPWFGGRSMSGKQAVTHPPLDGDRGWIVSQSAQQAAGSARTVASTSRTATGAPGRPAPTSARSPGPRPSPTPRDGGLSSPVWASRP